jgi:hypothetical protein
VILVGELRDLETMSIAVTAAEMGILVMGTLHTNGAGADRRPHGQRFPSDKQSHVRTMLSTSLRGVVSQQLLQRCRQAGPRRRAGDPGEYARRLQPHPPGQARSAGEHVMQAGAPRSACAPWTAPSSSSSTSGRSPGKEAYKKGINKAIRGGEGFRLSRRPRRWQQDHGLQSRRAGLLAKLD